MKKEKLMTVDDLREDDEKEKRASREAVVAFRTSQLANHREMMMTMIQNNTIV